MFVLMNKNLFIYLSINLFIIYYLEPFHLKTEMELFWTVLMNKNIFSNNEERLKQ